MSDKDRNTDSSESSPEGKKKGSSRPDSTRNYAYSSNSRRVKRSYYSNIGGSYGSTGSGGPSSGKGSSKGGASGGSRYGASGGAQGGTGGTGRSATSSSGSQGGNPGGSYRDPAASGSGSRSGTSQSRGVSSGGSISGSGRSASRSSYGNIYDTGSSGAGSSSRSSSGRSDDNRIRVRSGEGYDTERRVSSASSSGSAGSRGRDGGRDGSAGGSSKGSPGRRSGSSGRDSRRSRAGSGGGGRRGGGGAAVGRMESGFFESGTSSGRPSFVLVCFLIFALVIFVRLFLLQVIDIYGYSDTAANIRTAEETVYAKRGTIYDRNGNVLAMSVEATTVCCNPQQITDPEATAEELASILGGEADDYIDALTKDSSFAYIVRQVDTDIEDAITDRKSELKQTAAEEAISDAGVDVENTQMTLPVAAQILFCGIENAAQEADGTVTEVASSVLDGVYCVDEMKRVYPYGSVASQVVGTVDTDGNGISGLELYYDEILSGTDGYQTVERSRSGMDIPGGTTVIEESEDGTDIMISIDIELQAEAEEVLAEQVEEGDSESGNLVIIDGATGEIYAACSTPSYDPTGESENEEGAESLKAVTTVYEPGSIFKPVTAVALLEEGLATSDETITVPASRTFGEWTIEDSHEHGEQEMTFKEIIEQSSNIGISLLEERLGTETFYEYLLEYGFGTATGIDYPGEVDGSLAECSEWSEVQEANISFGQGLTVTTMQMASFYGMLAADGEYVQPHFLIGYPTTGETVEYEGTQVISEETCTVIDDMLSGVVEEGTGTYAAIEGYTVAGKTGTSQKIEDDGTYSDDAYMISFDGYLPYTDSTLACCVTVDNPTNEAAMTTFSEVMQSATEMYRVTVDEGDADAEDSGESEDAESE